jgi:hypothetical protein
VSPGYEAPYYVKGLALGLCAFLIGVHLWTWVFLSWFYLAGYSDFRQLYTSGYMVRAGYRGEFYNLELQEKLEDAVVSPERPGLPIDHPAYEALIFVPFSLLPYRPAYFAFLVINMALLAITYRLMRPWTQHLGAVFRWLPAALFVGFLPIASAVIEGQDSIIFLCLLVVSFVLIGKNKEGAAGLVVGLGTFKPQLALPVAALFFVWRRWRFVAGNVAGTLIALALSLFLVGRQQAVIYVRMLTHMGSSFPSHGYALLVQRMANLHGLIFGFLKGHASQSTVVIVTLLASATLFLMLARLQPLSGEQAFLTALCGSALLSYYLFIHDVSVLLLPMLIVLDRFVRAERAGPRSERVAFRAAVVFLVSQLLMSYAPEHFFLVAILVGALLVVVSSRDFRVIS